MNCKSYDNYIMRYFDGTLNDIETARFKQHLKTCGKCSTEFKNMDEIVTLLKASGQAEPPAGFTADIMKRIAALAPITREKNGKALTLLYHFTSAVSGVLIMLAIVAFGETNILEFMLGLLKQAGKAASSFTDLARIFRSSLDGGFGILSGIAGTLLETGTAIFKEYYHIFLILLAMLFAIQKTFDVFFEQRRGENQ